jgi:formate dehydrogenase major subunit
VGDGGQGSRRSVIHVDPRFTRTSALADQHVTVRAGTDIAFLGGVINYILANNLEFQEYVQAYTNAPFLVNEQCQDTEDLDGLFSGYDPHAAAYDRSSWSYGCTACRQIQWCPPVTWRRRGNTRAWPPRPW